MANPYVHSVSSAKKWGGEPEEYLAIHEKLDSSKKVLSDNRHRALTHHHWFILECLIPIFGSTISLSTGRKVSVKDIAENHIFEDFHNKFVPNAADYFQELPMSGWMQNGNGIPPSCKILFSKNKEKINESPIHETQARSSGNPPSLPECRTQFLYQYVVGAGM